MIELKNIRPVIELRADIGSGRNCSLPVTPGVYRWWFLENAGKTLISKLDDIDTSRINTRDINGYKYIALYFGIANGIKKRFKWHIAQHHTESTIKAGTISTLRHTLSALLGIQLSKSESCINEFIDRNCILEWTTTSSREEALVIETHEINSEYYPLNIRGNNVMSKATRQSLTQLRKRVKH